MKAEILARTSCVARRGSRKSRRSKTCSRIAEIDRIAFAPPVEQDGQRQASQRSRERQPRHEPAGLVFIGQVTEKFRDETEAGGENRNGENDQRGDHDPWRFSSRARLVAARLAEEDDDEQPRHVERGQEGREERERKDRRIFFVRGARIASLEKNPLKGGTADEGERADGESEKGHSQSAGQPAHLPDVLLVMQRVDDRAGAEEEQRLEEGVREEVEHRGAAATARPMAMTM